MRLIFRKSGENKEFLDAVFIDSMPENHKNQLTSYSHIGQHSACSIDWVYETYPAKESEYKELLSELISIYGHEFEVLKKLPNRSSLRLEGFCEF